MKARRRKRTKSKAKPSFCCLLSCQTFRLDKIQVRWRRKKSRFDCDESNSLPAQPYSYSPLLVRRIVAPSLLTFVYEKSEFRKQLCEFLTLVRSSQTKVYHGCLIELRRHWQPNSKRHSPLYQQPLLQISHQRLALIFSQGQVYQVHPLFWTEIRRSKVHKQNTHIIHQSVLQFLSDWRRTTIPETKQARETRVEVERVLSFD